MLYKISLLTLIFALQHNVFANETKDNLQRNEFSRELSPLTQNQIKQQNSKKSFSMKKHITKKQSLELTIERGLAAAEFQSVQEIEQAL